MSNLDFTAISNALVSARKSCTLLNAYPGKLPETLEQAYAIQTISISAWPADVIGFKAGGVPEHFRAQFPSLWQYGPIFSDQSYTVESGEKIEVTVFEGGFGAYEAELVFAVEGLDKIDGQVETIQDALSYVKTVYLGAEIASSPNPEVNNLGPGSIISDFGNNAGVVIGPEAPLSLLDNLSSMEVTLHIDGKEIGRATPNPGENGPLGALRQTLNHLVSRRGELDLPERILISSGAITGVHQSRTGTVAKLKFGELVEYELAMVPRRPIAVA